MTSNIGSELRNLTTKLFPSADGTISNSFFLLSGSQIVMRLAFIGAGVRKYRIIIPIWTSSFEQRCVRRQRRRGKQRAKARLTYYLNVEGCLDILILIVNLSNFHWNSAFWKSRSKNPQNIPMGQPTNWPTNRRKDRRTDGSTKWPTEWLIESRARDFKRAADRQTNWQMDG